MNAKNRTITALAAALALPLAAAPLTAAHAQTDQQQRRQKDKNLNRNLTIGLGALGVVNALRGRGGNAVLLGAGAAYTAKKYEDARKAQREENRRTARVKGDFQNAPISVVVDDQKMAFTGKQPEMTAGRVYVPLRGVMERIGAQVAWDPQSQTVSAVKGGKTVRLPAEGPATLNGNPISLDSPAYLEDGQVMIPLRFLSETFGAGVNWNEQARQVSITNNA